MGDFGQGYVGTSGDAAVGQSLQKKRAQLFAKSEEEKRRLTSETAAYRLKGESEKFATTSNAAEVQLVQATVGLMSKEEYGRVRREAEEGPPAETEEQPAEAKQEKKKKKKGGGGLSFAFDDEDEGADEGGAVAPPKKKSKKPPPTKEAGAPAAPPLAEGGSEAAGSSSTPASAPVAAKATVPAGHTCIRVVNGGGLELHVEVMITQTMQRSRVVGVNAQTISIDVKAADRGKGEEGNAALCGFLRSVLGGASVTAEVVRGHRAPLKVVRVGGVSTPDEAYNRLLLARSFGK